MADQADFTQADRLKLARYQAAAAEVQKQADEGTLYPQEAQQYLQRIQQMRAPLTAKQQAQEKQQKQKAKQDAMEQSALGEAVEQQHDLARARGFAQTVAVYHHPLSGESAHFYQSKRGTWEQIDFSKDRPAQAGGPAPGGE